MEVKYTIITTLDLENCTVHTAAFSSHFGGTFIKGDWNNEDRRKKSKEGGVELI